MTDLNTTIEHLPLCDNPEASVVIPHFYQGREDNFTGLIQDIRDQTFKSLEIIIINRVSPQGKAINSGVRIARGNILVIIDDDSRLRSKTVIENLINTLKGNPDVGMAGASVIIPETANWFQHNASKQFPRYHMPVVSVVTDSDLPGHPCAAFPKDVFIKIGMEREDILRGLDPDLRERIRKAGYRVVLAPETWVYHPLPESFSKFVRTFFRNGYGAAYIQKFHPEINYDTDENTQSSSFVAKRPFWYRLLRYPVRLIESLVRFEWIRFAGYTVYVFGYLWGAFQFYILKISPIKPSSAN